MVIRPHAYLKTSFFCEIAMVTRGFETRLQILPSKVLWYVALVSLTSATLYGAGICRYLGAGWPSG